MLLAAAVGTRLPLRSESDDDENNGGVGTPAKGLPIIALVITAFIIVVHLLKQAGCKMPYTIVAEDNYQEADGDDALLDGTPILPTQPGAELNNLV